MTSSPRKALASVERSSERGETGRAEAGQALQTQQPELPPKAPSPKDNLLPSGPSPQASRTYPPPYLSGKSVSFTPAFPGPRDASEPLRTSYVTGPTYPELPSPWCSAKRPASQTELHPSKSRPDGQSSKSSDIPALSTGAQFTSASLHNEPKRASSRARAFASDGPKALTHVRESQVVKRLPGRPRKNPVHPADLLKPTVARVDEDGHHITALQDAQERFPFINAFQGPAPSHGHTGAPIPNNRNLVALSPREVHDLHSYTGHRSAYQRPYLSPSNSSIFSTPRTPTQPLTSSSSSDALYGSPGVPIPLPPYPILPPPTALAPQPYPVQPSVEADGYIIIRNAISPALTRDVLTSINKGLPVFGKWDTAHTYATPIQAFKVRDEFVLKWRPALQPFYDSMRKSIPKMPSKSVIGAFTESDPRDIRHSLIHVGNANELYVHIALTPLSPETGLFHILSGSHRTKHPARTPVDDWSRTRIVLQEGDALVWRGDLHYLLSAKGGGYWQSLTFDWGPGVVDLTESPPES